MTVGELARRISRSVDTIKRWETEGLLVPCRDERDRRTYDENQVILAARLADLGIIAQRRSEKLTTIAGREPLQLALLSPLGAAPVQF